MVDLAVREPLGSEAKSSKGWTDARGQRRAFEPLGVATKLHHAQQLSKRSFRSIHAPEFLNASEVLLRVLSATVPLYHSRKKLPWRAGTVLGCHLCKHGVHQRGDLVVQSWAYADAASVTAEPFTGTLFGPRTIGVGNDMAGGQGGKCKGIVRFIQKSSFNAGINGRELCRIVFRCCVFRRLTDELSFKRRELTSC